MLLLKKKCSVTLFMTCNVVFVQRNLAEQACGHAASLQPCAAGKIRGESAAVRVPGQPAPVLAWLSGTGVPRHRERRGHLRGHHTVPPATA